MKIITFSKPFLTAAGFPFRSRERDHKTGDFFQQKDKDGKPILDANGQILAVMENAEFPRVLKEFVETVFILNRMDIEEAKQAKREIPPELTLEDTSRGTDIIRACNVSSGNDLDGFRIELENASYEWLEAKFTKYGLRSLGFNAGIVHEVVKAATDGGTHRAERRREEKAKK